ncbi:MAG TPA: hypothetical protein VNR87_00870 [Flavisolibacter sp.]|nr:hypothetical protein [Flavisolibacter sp.]
MTAKFNKQLDMTSEMAWEYMKEINENVRHYNEHQTKYRTLASQWLLGAFAGIGFVLYSEGSLPFNKLWIVFGICLASSLGIYQLWRMDMVIFQRLLGAFFFTGKKIEAQEPHLPQVKQRIVDVIPSHNVGETLFYFYFFMVAVLLTFGCISLIYIGKNLDNNFTTSAWFVTMSIAVFGGVLFNVWRHMRKQSTAVGEEPLPPKNF